MGRDRSLDYRSRRHLFYFFCRFYVMDRLYCVDPAALSGPNTLGAASALIARCRSYSNYHAGYADQTLSFLSSDLLLIPRATFAFDLGKSSSKFDYEFVQSRPLSTLFVWIAAAHPLNGPGQTHGGLYISGTRLNKLDGDHTTACTPPFQMIDNRPLTGANGAASRPLGLCHDIPRCLILGYTLNPLRSFSTDDSV